MLCYGRTLKILSYTDTETINEIVLEKQSEGRELPLSLYMEKHQEKKKLTGWTDRRRVLGLTIVGCVRCKIYCSTK